MKQITYSFKPVLNCNMCNAPASDFKILGRRMNTSQGKSPSKRIGISTTVVKCSNCHLIFSNPQPIPARIEDHYGVEPEEYWKGEHFIPNSFFIKSILEKAQFHAGKNGRLLDIGSGVGNTMKVLLDAGFDVFGFEPSGPFYKYSITNNGIPAERVQHKSLEEAEFPKNYFDYILFRVVLEHIYDPSEGLKKAMSWTKKGGKIEIEVPSSRWLINKLANLFYKLQNKDYVVNISPMHQPYHLFEFDIKSFQLNGERFGYKVVDHHYFVAKTYMPKILDGLFTWVMSKTKTGMQLIVVLEKL